MSPPEPPCATSGASKPSMPPSLHQIAPGLTFIQRGWLNGNHLVSTTGPLTLVDSGYLGGLDQTLELLAQAGAQAERVERIITTHLHCDHVGGHEHLHRLSGCQIYAHERCRRALAMQDGRATWHQFYGQDYAWFPTHHSLSDGQVIDLGGMDWTCLHTPGHAAGHLCLFCPDTGDLISADVAWEGDFGVLTSQVEGWDCVYRLRESLRRISRLPVKRMWPGHGPPIADGPAAIAACLERVERFIQKPHLVADDQMRKIMLYTVMMRGPLSQDDLWRTVNLAPWFGEACSSGFSEKPRQVFRRFVEELLAKRLIEQADGTLRCLLQA